MNKKITKYCLPILILVLIGSISFIQFVGAENTVVITTGTISPIISLISSNTNNVSGRGILNSGVDDNVNLTAGLFSFLANIFKAIVNVVVAVVVAVVQAVVAVVQAVVAVVVAIVETVVNVVTSIVSPSPPSYTPPPPSYTPPPPPSYSCWQWR